MTIEVTQSHPLFAGEVSGIDLRNPPSADDFLAIAQSFDRFAVLVFREQPLNDEQQIAFSQLFGPLETSIGAIRTDRKQRLRRELADISNLDEHNNIRRPGDNARMRMLANQLWHTDSSFKRVPGKISMLSAREVPAIGGDTEFADLRAAYDALDEATKARVEGLVAEHSIFHSRSLIWIFGFYGRRTNGSAACPTNPGARTSGLRPQDLVPCFSRISHHQMAVGAGSSASRRTH
jgi:alpha-ketoglutarate-dependent 2,4-dichlorophenoxyacetate dioxygenase